MNHLGLLLLALVAADPSGWDRAKAPRPEEYSVSTTFHGAPAAAHPTTRNGRRFRTVIGDGAKNGPNFAGHFTIIVWGCGTSCYQMAIADALSGEVFDTPFSHVSMLPPYRLPDDIDFDRAPDFGERTFDIHSRLLLVSGCLDESPKECGWHYYKWTGAQLRRLVRIPFPPVEALPREPKK